MNRWAKEINGNQTLIIGAENWPFPIPLKKDAAGTWYFDTKAGVKEILFRRIGKNELAAIRVCGVLADAQDEYFGQKTGSTRKNSPATPGSRTDSIGRPTKDSQRVPSGRW